MKKTKIVLIAILALIMVATFVVLPGCQTTAAETTAAETAAETAAAAGGTTYEDFREMAKAGAYIGEPAKGRTLAFANIIASFPFCQSVEKNIIDQWALAGGASADLTVLDNAADPALAIQNKDIIFNKNPEVFLQFQLDAKVNDQIAMEAKEKGIFIIAIDVPVGDFPFMGVNNYGTAELTGKWAVEQIDKVFGGWDNVDLVIYPYNPTAGETVQLRIVGSMDVFKEEFGEEADGEKEGSKAILVDAGSTTDEAKAAFTDILAAYPQAENIVVFCLNDQTASGFNAAAEIAGRWDPDKFLVMSQGLDDLGIELVRKGIIDGNSAYFPEKYGEYLIPGALAYMYGGAEAVPKEMFIENVIITPENIDEYYPE